MSSYVRTPEEISPMIDKGDGELYNLETVTVFFETDLEIVRKLLPPPLEAIDEPYAYAYGSNIGSTNAGDGYHEVAVCLPCQYNGIKGAYTICIPVDGDMGMLAYRETVGFPKKMANIKINYDGTHFHCRAERHGIDFVEIEADLNGKLNDPAAFKKAAASTANPPYPEGPKNKIGYRFKYCLSPEGGFMFDPILYSVPGSSMARGEKSFGTAKLTFRYSKHDPIAELPIKNVLGAVHSYTHNFVYRSEAKALCTIPGEQFLPYLGAFFDVPETRFLSELG